MREWGGGIILGFLQCTKHGNLWNVDGHFESGSCSILNHMNILSCDSTKVKVRGNTHLCSNMME
jgi:hypothetical protein